MALSRCSICQVATLRQGNIAPHSALLGFAPAFRAQGYVNIAEYVISKISTESVTRFQLSDFKQNDFKSNDIYSRHLTFKKLGQKVTNCVRPNDFRPSDHLLRQVFVNKDKALHQSSHLELTYLVVVLLYNPNTRKILKAKGTKRRTHEQRRGAKRKKKKTTKGELLVSQTQSRCCYLIIDFQIKGKILELSLDSEPVGFS